MSDDSESEVRPMRRPVPVREPDALPELMSLLPNSGVIKKMLLVGFMVWMCGVGTILVTGVTLYKQVGSGGRFPANSFVQKTVRPLVEQHRDSLARGLGVDVHDPRYVRLHDMYTKDMKSIQVGHFSTRSDFQSKFVSKSKPVMYKNAIGETKAYRTWNRAYFNSAEIVGAKRDVYVNVTVVADNIIAAVHREKYKTEMLMSKFINVHLFGVKLPGNESLSTYYLAYYPMEKLHPGMAKDVPHEIKPTSELKNRYINLGSGEVTFLPLRHVLVEQVLIQVRGHSLITLFPPTERENLYVEPDVHGHIISPIDFVNTSPEVLAKKYPKFKKATRIELIANHGDAVFIPAFWYFAITHQPPNHAPTAAGQKSPSQTLRPWRRLAHAADPRSMNIAILEQYEAHSSIAKAYFEYEDNLLVKKMKKEGLRDKGPALSKNPIMKKIRIAVEYLRGTGFLNKEEPQGTGPVPKPAQEGNAKKEKADKSSTMDSDAVKGGANKSNTTSEVPPAGGSPTPLGTSEPVRPNTVNSTTPSNP